MGKTDGLAGSVAQQKRGQPGCEGDPTDGCGPNGKWSGYGKNQDLQGRRENDVDPGSRWDGTHLHESSIGRLGGESSPTRTLL